MKEVLYQVIELFDWYYLAKIAFRLALAVVTGGLIGNERQRHGRAAGIRTHILVCLGAALTALFGEYLSTVTGSNGDIQRISAQVISRIGFLGAGMIIVKNSNVISGLTTAAGVWTTSTIGIAIGYGFYYGAVIAVVLFLVNVIFFTKLEKRKNATEMIYVEIDDMYKTNKVVEKIRSIVDMDISYSFIAAKSKNTDHLGIYITIEEKLKFHINKLCDTENIVYVIEE